MQFDNPWRRRVPFIPQMEMMECGAASLGMVLGYHDCHVSLAELRAACSVSRDGASAHDIVKAAKLYGLGTRAFKAGLEDLDEVALPAVLHWEFNHFLVLERLLPDGADLVDPARGRRRVSLEELGRAFTGVVIELLPEPTFAKRRGARRSMDTYKGLLRGAAGPVSVMTLSAFLLEVLGLVFPAATALVVDFVIRPRQEQWVVILAIAFGTAIALRAAISIARDRILGGLEARLDVELAATLVKHLISLPTAFFSQRGTGELLNRVGALLAARETFARVFLAGFDVLLVGAYGTLMLLYDFRLGGVVMALKVLTVIVTAIGRRRGRSAARTCQIASGRAQSALVQAFADPETAKAFGAEALLLVRYGAARARELNARVDKLRLLEPAQHALAILQALGTALLLWFGGRAVLDDRLTLGVLASFLALQTLLGPPLDRIVLAFQDLGELGPLLDRVDDIFDSPPEPSGAFVPDRIEGAITFENVSFRYGSKGPMLLDGVSFHVAAGERVAIAGRSGAGKSTILKLILGFVAPLSGTIQIDGRDVRDYDLDALRSSVGTVLAGGAFFDESIFDNVTLGAPEATLGELRGALSAACVADVVDGLPRGALTRLGTGAKRLSGGQRQRLLLARALVKNPTMLLLDEASSALDTELEQRVQAFLSQMRCTMVVVAHRLSAVALADRVLFLDEGKIIQEGSFHVLAREAGPFQDLVRASEVPA